MRNFKTGQSVKKTIDLTEQLASKNGQQKRNVIGLSFGADEAGKPYISPRFGTPKNSNVSSTAVPETEGQQDLATPTTPPTQAPEPSSFVQTVPGRTIPSAVGLGKNPLVIINGKQYPADILLRLDPQKMGGPGTFGPSNPFALKKWGEKARDGVIEFTPRTADFELSDAGKRKIAAYNAENEFKALANSPRTRVVVRIPQMTYEGKRYEMVYCVSQSSRCGTEVFLERK
ncbi:MAG: hypothetical protein LH606_02020 [Cytophagaceae bacterium]|nr:hypothetical protein [Cytophagaceae bacterium]